MMKKICIAVLLVMGFMKVFPQAEVATTEEFKQFLKTKTYVVYEDDPFSVFNMGIKDIMTKCWTITPYEFIDMKTFDVKKSDPKNSFIMISDAMLTKNKLFVNEIKYQYKYTILNLILGRKGLTGTDFSAMPDLGSVPLCYSEAEGDDYSYKLPGILLFMQYYVRYNIDHPNSDYKDVVRSNSTELKTKELWLLKEELAPNVNTVEKIKAIYSGTVKIVSPDDLEAAILAKNDKVAFLHKIGPAGAIPDGICWKFIISAKDGKPLYYDHHKIDADSPDALLAKDFKGFGK